MYSHLVISASLLALTSGIAHASNFGVEVPNIADITYTDGSVESSLRTNEVIFIIRPPVDENPTIEFFRYSSNAPTPQLVTLNGSEFSPSGDIEGPFVSTGEPLNTGNLLDISGEVPLISTSTYLSGELMFVRVTNMGANLNSSEIDRLVVTVEADNGDMIVLRLYESGPDTGEFWAYMQSTDDQTGQYDAVVTAGNNDHLTATYEDTIVDANSGGNVKVRVVVDTAAVNPSNTVFDSTTGEPLNGAVISLLTAGSEGYASVYGVDAFSEFPATVTSGELVTDSGGLNYEQDIGTFTFPYIGEGEYVIEVIPPEGYNFASAMSPDVINSNTGAGYFILDASYGRAFSQTEAGYLRLDIPLDPESELLITKSADRSYVDVGDFISYTVTMQNLGQRTAPAQIHDTLPIGFRYVDGTSIQDSLRIADPAVSDDATLLTYPIALIAPGETVTLNYALEVGPGAYLGDAINEAIARDSDGDALSNIARAQVELREDLMRSRSTIIGRITQNSCNGDEDWAREITRGDGVEGIRLYMETGAHAVSDPDGLYHFEGITEGTHVVQVDEATLPAGFEIMTCEENSRYAGSARSKFVDVQGGGIWRANFYLKQTGDVADTTVDTEEFEEATNYQKFNQSWINNQSAKVEWVYPATDRTPDRASVNLGIKHPAGASVQLTLNGRPVPGTNRDRGETSSNRLVGLTRFRGVDIREGRNVFEAVVKGGDGQVIKALSEDVWYVTNVARAAAVPNLSNLVADGRTAPELAIRLEDETGRSVHNGQIVDIQVEAPYQLYDKNDRNELKKQTNDLIAPFSARQEIKVGNDGIAMVKLQPTLQTGKVTVIVTLDNGRQIPLYLYLEPEKRDWIVVGLAEGSVGYETIKDKAISLSDSEKDTFTDGRVAFFAKGLIKGNWLMTLAVDTDKRRGDTDSDFASEIDPNAYYTLYGDRSYQELEAKSRYPVYLKLEKKSVSALFGDFDTDIREGRLTSYNRRLSGLKAEYVSEKLQVLGFAAETNQGFAKDELAADGTSGTYQLSQQRILAQSETITIETRDRNRPDIVLETKTLVRYLDYTLDYLTGQLIFRLPVDASDTQFNPNVIVVDYETSEEAERNITAGGRIQVQNGRVRAGSSFVHQEGSGQTAGVESNMIGLDIVAKINDNTEARIEYAVTENKAAGIDSNVAEGLLAEIIHTSESVSAEAYYREEEQGYGVGQTNSNTAGFRRYGVKGNVRVNQFENEETGRRGSQSIEGTAYHEDNLTTGSTRDTVEVMAHHQGDKLKVGAGIRASQDELASGERRDSLLAVASASLQIPKHGASIQFSHEQPLGGDDAVSNYPQRTTIGLTKSIADKAVVSIRHELLNGDNANSQNTVVGLNVSPWKNSTITASSDLVTNVSGRRLGGTVGLDQQIRIDKNMTASIGVTNRKLLDQKGTHVDVSADAAISPLEVNEDFTSAYVGLGYNTEKTTVSGRLETRQAGVGDTWIASLGAARELSEELSLASSLRAVATDPNNTLQGDESQIDARIGAAWRPRSEDTVIFDRLDISHKTSERGETRTKIVNNLAANTMVSDRWQLSANYGAKYVREDIAGKKLTSFNHLIGGETRFDITKKIDIGLHGSVLTNGDSAQYSFGPSIGFAPVDDVWISAGYNIEGFSDDDFEAAEYSRDGIYLKLRIKFDQDTAKGLLKRISPDASTVGTTKVHPQAFSAP